MSLPVSLALQFLISRLQLAPFRHEGVVNEDDRYNALAEGKVFHSASDVFATEPPGEHPLLKLLDFTASPRIVVYTSEGQFRVGMKVAEKVINALKP